jgi:PAS domain-containing protein
MIDITPINTVNFFEVTQYLQQQTGDDKIQHRLYELLKNAQYGNQDFCNDSYFIYCVPECEELLSPDELLLKNTCVEALDMKHSDFGTIVFYVEW